jgi:hypothetical protein
VDQNTWQSSLKVKITQRSKIQILRYAPVDYPVPAEPSVNWQFFAPKHGDRANNGNYEERKNE